MTTLQVAGSLSTAVELAEGEAHAAEVKDAQQAAQSGSDALVAQVAAAADLVSGLVS